MGEARQYCLKWNNHPRNVATVFDRCGIVIIIIIVINIIIIIVIIVMIIVERLRAEELFVDVTLATADRQVR